MSTMTPTIAMLPLTISTSAQDDASRSSIVSDVTRVSISPAGRAVTAGMVAPKNRRTIDDRASSTTRSAMVPRSRR